MVRALAGDSTITSRLTPLPRAPPLAFLPLAAVPVLAATLFTLASRGRPGGYRRQPASTGAPVTLRSLAAGADYRVAAGNLRCRSVCCPCHGHKPAGRTFVFPRPGDWFP